MNPILDFYGYYGTESALQNERSKVGDFALRVYRRIKDFKFESYLDRLKTRASDFDQLSVDNLKKEDSDFPFDYKAVKKLLETAKVMKEVNSDLIKVFKTFEEFQTALESLKKDFEAYEKGSNSDTSVVQSLTFGAAIEGISLFMRKIFSENGFINPLRQNLLNGLDLIAILFGINAVVSYVMYLKHNFIARRNMGNTYELYKKAYDKLDWKSIKKVVSKLHNIPKTEPLTETDVFPSLEKGKYKITYDEKVELVNLLKEYWVENKNKMRDNLLDVNLINGYSNVRDSAISLYKYNIDYNTNMITTYLENDDIEKFNMLLVLHMYIASHTSASYVLVEISSYLNRL